jgi:hypothetical protein
MNFQTSTLDLEKLIYKVAIAFAPEELRAQLILFNDLKKRLHLLQIQFEGARENLIIVANNAIDKLNATLDVNRTDALVQFDWETREKRAEAAFQKAHPELAKTKTAVKTKAVKPKGQRK